MIKTKIKKTSKRILNMNLKSWKLKIDKLKHIRNDIKKRRLILDEGKERFGLDEMYQLTKVKNTSEVKGYPFKVKKKIDNETFKFGLKIIPVSVNYEKNNHPSFLESIVLKELTDNILHKNISPHIVYYLGNQKVSNKSRALKFLNLKRLEIENEIKNYSYMLISEYVTGGSLDNWVYNTYEKDENISDIQWKYIVFQLIYTIAVMQKKYRLMHNDFHYGNILIDTSIKPEGYFVYKIYDKIFYIKNTGIIPKVWDFEFSMCYSDNMKDFYPNKFILAGLNYDKKRHVTLNEKDLKDHLNVPVNYNEFYDLHYFLTSLLDLYISQELFNTIINTSNEKCNNN
jgi:serine/threonine protein kinase